MVRRLASPKRTLGTSGFIKTGEFSNAAFEENAPATHNNYLDRAKILLNDAISTGFRSRVVEEEMVKATIRNTRKVTDEKLKAMDEWEKRYDESRNN